MFCPKCNQQQASDEMRFCARCGFPLSAVADLIAHNGVPTKVEKMHEDPLWQPPFARGALTRES
jgi:predicted amidophosphoribosyltransferase